MGKHPDALYASVSPGVAVIGGGAQRWTGGVSDLVVSLPPCEHEGQLRERCIYGANGDIHECDHPQLDGQLCKRGYVGGRSAAIVCASCPLHSRYGAGVGQDAVARLGARLIRRFDETGLFPSYPGLRFNSSLVREANGYVMCFRTGWAGSDLVCCRLDRDLNPVGSCRRIDIRHDDANYGREDPRLFWHKGRLHVAFIGVRGESRKGWNGVTTHQLFARLSGDFSVEDVFHPHYDRRRTWEKNWQFFDVDGELYAVHSVTPFVVLKIESNRATVAHVHDWRPGWHGGEMRGGASPVLVGDEFWCWFHDRVDGKSKLCYRTGLFTFSARPPFQPARIVRRPVLVADSSTNPGNYADVVFTCGAVRDGGRWVLSSGIHDRWTELHEVDHGVVLGELAETRLTVDAPGEYCAVTIGIGAGFSEMAGRHGETVRRAFGCDGLVVLGEDMLDAWCPSQSLFPDVARRVFWLKFCIPLICPGLKRWVYCDADYRIVGDVDAVVLEQVRHDERLIAVRDSWSDGALPYYNAGFYVANRKQHSGLLEWCRSNYFGVREVFGEQCVWNAGIRALGLDVLELPGAYNVRTEGECERNRVVGAHGFWWRG